MSFYTKTTPLIFCLALILAATIPCQGQIPEIIFKKCYGGSREDARALMSATKDGGYILAGYGNSTDGDMSGTVYNGGQDDIEIMLLDACGNITRRSYFGGNRSDRINNISPTNDGGFLLCGTTTSSSFPNYRGGPCDAIACKIDSEGNLQWIKSFGGSGMEGLQGAVFFPDSSCIVAGSSNSLDGDGHPSVQGFDGWLIKLDKHGNIIWKKLIGGAATENYVSIYPAQDGNFIITGQRDISDNNSDGLLTKIDPDGNVIWERRYGGSGDDHMFAIKPVAGGGYIITGHTSSPEIPGYHGAVDAWVLLINEDGTLRWQRSIGGSKAEHLMGVTVLPGNQFVFGGGSLSSDGDITSPNRGAIDAFAFSLDETGRFLWGRSLGGSTVDVFFSAFASPDGSLVFGGYTSSNDGDIQGNHGGTDFLLCKLRDVRRYTDTTSCGPLLLNNKLFTQNTFFIDTTRDRCMLDSIRHEYNITILPAPSVQTIADTIITPGTSAVLHTTASGPVTWTGAGLNCYTCLNPIATPSVATQYIVKTGTAPCLSADTVLVSPVIPDTLFIPSAFTPNNDGKNDILRASGMVIDFHFTIYNRWGQPVFTTRSIQNGWNGQLGGMPQNAGIYVYIARYKTRNGSARLQKGTFMLIR